MKATVLGHASFLFESGMDRLLIDPVLRTTSLYGLLGYQWPRAVDLESLPHLTGILITHAHFDHFDPQTLAMLPRDVPVIIPPDRRMERTLSGLGFSNLVHLETWQSVQHGSLRLTATPSDAPVKEFGLIVQAEGACFWHTSDAEAPEGTASRIVAEQGPVDVVSTKFQPPDAQLNFQHNMGSSFDRRSVASWLEAACECRPKLIFPYASGLCFGGEHAWLNRYAFPLSAEFAARLLAERLAGSGTATLVRPGDVLAIENRQVHIEEQASPFVRATGPETLVDWEPFDDSLLIGLGSDAERQQLQAELNDFLFDGQFALWLAKSSEGEGAGLTAFRDWRALCQIVVHLGSSRRWYAQVDFTGEHPVPRPGATRAATYFTHIGAESLRRLMRGQASTLEVMLGGHVRIYERLIAVRNSRLDAPPTKLLYKDFPDPWLTFGSAARRRTKPQPAAL